MLTSIRGIGRVSPTPSVSQIHNSYEFPPSVVRSVVLMKRTKWVNTEIRSLLQWTCSPYSHSVVQISYQSVSNQRYRRILCPTRLSVGDLGVQRGLCRWYLSLHSEEHPIVVSPRKKKTPAKTKSAKKGKNAVIKEDKEEAEDASGDCDDNTGPSGSSKPAGAVTNIPPPLTPSVTKILKTKPLSQPPPGLPEGLSVAMLKSRLSGKKVK